MDYTLCHISWFFKIRYKLFSLYAHYLLYLHCKSNMIFHPKENDLCFLFSNKNLNEWINMSLPFSTEILYYMVSMFVSSGSLCLFTSTLKSMVPMQSVPTTTNVEFESSPGEVYSIQHYAIKFVSELWQVGSFLRVLRFPPPIKLTAMI